VGALVGGLALRPGVVATVLGALATAAPRTAGPAALVVPVAVAVVAAVASVTFGSVAPPRAVVEVVDDEGNAADSASTGPGDSSGCDAEKCHAPRPSPTRTAAAPTRSGARERFGISIGPPSVTMLRVVVDSPAAMPPPDLLELNGESSGTVARSSGPLLARPGAGVTALDRDFEGEEPEIDPGWLLTLFGSEARKDDTRRVLAISAPA
jgi:hypothetical protein